MWTLHLPKRIIFGEEALNELSLLPGSRILVITDHVLEELGLLERCSEVLKEAGFETQVFSDVSAEPSTETIEEAAGLAREFEPDSIVGFGGGSVMDVSKGVSILFENPEFDLAELSPFAHLSPRKRAFLITIPTTAGTGAEVSWAIVPTDTQENRKLELAHGNAVPDFVILDPSLLSSAPPHLLAAGGFDALANAVESFLSDWANEYTEAFALGALPRIFSTLPSLVRNPSDTEAASTMLNASVLGGLAFSSSQVTLAHSIAHAIGALFKTPHGQSVAAVLPEVLDFYLSEPKAVERMLRLHAAVGEPNPSAKGLVDRVRLLRTELNLPASVSDLGIEKEAYLAAEERVAERTNESTCTLTSPRIPDQEELRELLQRIFSS